MSVLLYWTLFNSVLVYPQKNAFCLTFTLTPEEHIVEQPGVMPKLFLGMQTGAARYQNTNLLISRWGALPTELQSSLYC